MAGTGCTPLRAASPWLAVGQLGEIAEGNGISPETSRTCIHSADEMHISVPTIDGRSPSSSESWWACEV